MSGFPNAWLYAAGVCIGMFTGGALTNIVHTYKSATWVKCSNTCYPYGVHSCALPLVSCTRENGGLVMLELEGETVRRSGDDPICPEPTTSAMVKP